MRLLDSIVWTQHVDTAQHQLASASTFLEINLNFQERKTISRIKTTIVSWFKRATAITHSVVLEKLPSYDLSFLKSQLNTT